MRLGLVICWIFVCLSLYGQQVLVNTFPQDWQLIPRDTTTNLATIQIEGTVVDSTYSYAILEVFSDSLSYQLDSIEFEHIPNEPFQFVSQIPAELHDYTFRLWLADSTGQYLIQEATKVVAGDVFLIQGQSNAYANLYVEPSYTELQNPWIRSFGSSSMVPTEVQNNLNWYSATARSSLDGRVGIWGMELGNMLSNYHGIPIAIINGSVSGSSIEEHQFSTNLLTIYGRLLYRCQQASVDTLARAIIWWQGERDASGMNVSDLQEYYDAFFTLQNSWLTDYPNLEHIYLAQIHTVHNNLLGSEIREAQRRIGNDFPKVTLQSTHNLGAFDNFAHHGPSGYQLFADRIYQQIQRDIYGIENAMADPPQLLTAKYKDGLKNRIELKFTQPVNWEDELLVDGMGYVYLKDYIFLDNDWGMVDSAKAIGNQITLYLEKSVSATTISYLPSGDYHNNNIIYVGPWITNDLGTGVISFYQFPIEEAESPFQLKVNLEGAYSDSLGKMQTMLNIDHQLLPGQSASLSSGHPYSQPPWNYMGTEGATFDGRFYNEEVVDWVLISLREELASSTEVFKAACLLDDDGQIRFVESPGINLTATDSFYIVVEHRNHIGVMSTHKVVVNQNTLMYDFTNQNSYTGIGGEGSFELSSGTWVMFAGDGDQTNDLISYDINGEDRRFWEIENGNFSNYTSSDYNLDGDVNGNDRILWLKNNGITSRVLK